jgi:hypothetical protein
MTDEIMIQSATLASALSTQVRRAARGAALQDSRLASEHRNGRAVDHSAEPCGIALRCNGLSN